MLVERENGSSISLCLQSLAFILVLLEYQWPSVVFAAAHTSKVIIALLRWGELACMPGVSLLAPLLP